MTRDYILIVDDSQPSARLIESALEVDGYSVRVCANATAALALASHTRLALALVDLQLPDMPGAELARLLRGMPHLASTPLIGVTAGDGPEEAALARASGMSDVLQKPISMAFLRRLVATLTQH